MKIILLRFSSQEDSTSGALFKANDDGTKDFLCYTIEDEYRLKKDSENIQLYKMELEAYMQSPDKEKYF